MAKPVKFFTDDSYNSGDVYINPDDVSTVTQSPNEAYRSFISLISRREVIKVSCSAEDAMKRLYPEK